MAVPFTASDAARLDELDPLRPFRDRFVLPEAVTYLDGNSLGALPKRVADAVGEAVTRQWGEGLVGSWNTADWIGLPQRIGVLLAPLIGATAAEVVACDSTTINIHKLVTAARKLQPTRDIIVCERTNFPSDAYAVQAIARATGASVIEADAHDISEAIASAGSRLAVVELTHVHYKTGYMYDMAAVTEATHRQGGLIVWDLAHSAGAFPVDLSGCQADFAVGCGYKYLNGGPGAPAFVYVARRHLGLVDNPLQNPGQNPVQNPVQNPLPGWMGHAQPFDFAHEYQPAAGVDRMLTGTPSVLSMVALEAALLDWADVDLAQVRKKSVALTELFIRLVDEQLEGYGFDLASPRVAAQRGSQVSLTHPEGYAMVQALIDRNVIGDFRAPDILRFGVTPLYTRYVDIWNAVDALRAIMHDETWKQPRFRTPKHVT
jgi:kynureninase